MRELAIKLDDYLFFSRKEPKALALRGFDAFKSFGILLHVFREANQCFLLRFSGRKMILSRLHTIVMFVFPVKGSKTLLCCEEEKPLSKRVPRSGPRRSPKELNTLKPRRANAFGSFLEKNK
jgi:hypothetical protein